MKTSGSIYQFLTVTGCLAMCASVHKIPQLILFNANTFVPNFDLEKPMSFEISNDGVKISQLGPQLKELLNHPPQQMSVNNQHQMIFKYNNDAMKKPPNPPQQSVRITGVIENKNGEVKDNKIGTENNEDIETTTISADYTTETTEDYESTTFNDEDLVPRLGVADNVAASLLG